MVDTDSQQPDLAPVRIRVEHEGRMIPPEHFSGQVNARLPNSLHRALAQRAEVEGLSVNATWSTC